MSSAFVLIAGVSGFLGVALGAFGAHALRKRLSADSLSIFQTGVQYQMYHTFAILLVALFRYWAAPSHWVVAAGWCFTAGIVLFSGSLYMLALTKNRAFGPITPLGGLVFLVGWAMLIIGSFSVM